MASPSWYSYKMNCKLFDVRQEGRKEWKIGIINEQVKEKMEERVGGWEGEEKKEVKEIK